MGLSRFDHQAVRTYVYSVGNFQFIMASQSLTRGQLEKMSNENLIASFLALQDNIILRQNDLLQQNRDISSKIDSLAEKNEELTSHVSVAQNASKILQEAFNTTSSKQQSLKDNITNWNSIRGGNAWTSQASLTQSHQKT